MKDVARYLITTADEQTWKFDRPVVFLGEWCLSHERKHVWEKMDAVVAPPYGMEPASKDADHARARALEEKLFPEFSALLNQHHGTQHGDRFWQIVLGHWFRRAIEVLLNRVRTIKQCLQLFNISDTATHADNWYSLAPLDSLEAIWAFNDDCWNGVLATSIIGIVQGRCRAAPVSQVSDVAQEVTCYKSEVSGSRASLKRRALEVGFRHFSNVARRFVQDDDVFILRSYLPRRMAVALELALGQVPQMWVSPRADTTARHDLRLRADLTAKFLRASDDHLENAARELLFEMLPVCFLEGFCELNRLARLQPWPKRPTVIWTSNAFDTDEIFKLWTAAKAEEGCSYFVGQHGNNYGTHRYLRATLEESTSDRFLTWGWTDGLLQHTPTFIFKTAGKKEGIYSSRGGLLLIENSINHRLTTWDVASEFAAYLADQMEFICRLSIPQKKALTVRLHGTFGRLAGGELSIWREFDPTLRIDTGGAPLGALIAQSRLVVHSYDSTGILEGLAQNIPTLAFWQNGFDHLRDSARPHYQELVDAGIVHLSAASAAAKVDEIWEDVDGWWRGDVVQAARKRFSDVYARLGESPVRQLRDLLRASRTGMR